MEPRPRIRAWGFALRGGGAGWVEGSEGLEEVVGGCWDVDSDGAAGAGQL